MSLTRSIRMLDSIAPGAPALAGFAAAMAGVAALLYPVPLFMAWVILDEFLAGGTGQPFPWLPCLTAAVAVILSGALRAYASYTAHKSAFRICRGLRLTLAEHLGKIPLHWFSTQSTGSLKKVFTQDVGEVEGFISHNIPDFMFALILPLLSIICLAVIDWRLALVLTALLLAALAVQGRSFKEMQTSNIMNRYQTALTMLHADAVEFVQGMPEVKIFNRSTESFGRMQRAIENMRGMGEEACSFYATQWARFLAVTNMPLTLLGCTGGALYLTGSLPLADLGLFLALGGISLLPMNRLIRFVAILMRTFQGWSEVQQLLSLPVEQRGNRRREEIGTADLEIRDLQVAYGDTPVLKGISFSAKAGTVTAIVGPSGSGKSTLTAVLAGMEAAASGSITLGGIELTDFSNKELARSFSIVFQQPFIFGGTVRENILLGSEHASQEDLERAVKQTCCGDLIAELPHGYDTRIGSEGEVHLSGGQRQRIALARMALRDTPVVLLDEATAFADPESEAAIQEGLSGFLTGKTVLVVAHRLPSIAHADNILVLEDGIIAEQGKHDELLKANGLYAGLWEANRTARSWTISTGRKKFDGLRDEAKEQEVTAC